MIISNRNEGGGVEGWVPNKDPKISKKILKIIHFFLKEQTYQLISKVKTVKLVKPS